jgi:hypothetical protein
MRDSMRASCSECIMISWCVSSNKPAWRRYSRSTRAAYIVCICGALTGAQAKRQRLHTARAYIYQQAAPLSAGSGGVLL